MSQRATPRLEGTGNPNGSPRRRAARARQTAPARTATRDRAGEGALSELFRVSFVCTGNRFRSPLAAALLAGETEGLPLRIVSLGTLDLGSKPALPEAVAIAEELGLDLSGHASRNLASVDLEPFDVVLGFERKHVMASVVEARAQIERTFTLPELVGLLGRLPGAPLPTDPVERALVRIRQAHALRPPDFRKGPLPELGDPLGLTLQAQRKIAAELAALVRALADGLFD